MTELLLIATIAGQRIAISSRHVDSVVEIERVTPVPRSADFVLGLASLRSRVFTVIDPAAALGLGQVELSGNSDAVVVEADGHLYALLVDCVEDAIAFEGEVRPVAAPLAAGWREAATGMVETGGDVLLLIDAHALLAGPAACAA
jgi:purine-binding chemotaxis protein CheW